MNEVNGKSTSRKPQWRHGHHHHSNRCSCRFWGEDAACFGWDEPPSIQNHTLWGAKSLLHKPTASFLVLEETVTLAVWEVLSWDFRENGDGVEGSGGGGGGGGGKDQFCYLETRQITGESVSGAQWHCVVPQGDNWPNTRTVCQNSACLDAAGLDQNFSGVVLKAAPPYTWRQQWKRQQNSPQDPDDLMTRVSRPHTCWMSYQWQYVGQNSRREKGENVWRGRMSLIRWVFITFVKPISVLLVFRSAP